MLWDLLQLMRRYQNVESRPDELRPYRIRDRVIQGHSSSSRNRYFKLIPNLERMDSVAETHHPWLISVYEHNDHLLSRIVLAA
jgi:hypothetical protein